MIDELIKIYDRDLDRLKNEIKAFEQESNLWKTTGRIKNPAGNLCLHLAGNLNTYIGRNIGQTGYIRDRYAEFHLKNVPKETLLEQVDDVQSIVLSTISQMEGGELEEIHTENIFGYEMTNGFLLIHLAAHLSYHLGQINYLRRILE